MSAEQQSPIRFQIEESVWLDHHADAAKIVTLDLEPEVHVTEADQLINIRGHLVLTGRFLTGDDENDSLDLESSSLADQLQFQPLKVDQKEIVQGESRGSIENRFPVDVTVPADKVSHVEDVHVDIEHFDYTVSEGRCLNIRADIALRGVENGLKVDNTSQQQEDSEIRNFAQPSTFEVSASKDQGKEEHRQEAVEEGEAAEEKETTDIFEQEQKGPGPADAATEDQTREATQGKSGQDEPVQAEEKPDQEEVKQEFIDQAESTVQAETTDQGGPTGRADSTTQEDFTDQEDPAESKVVDLFDTPIRTNFNPSVEPFEQGEAQGEDDENRDTGENNREQGEAQTSESQTASFLTQLMSGDEEEGERTQFARMKMCIIQRSESLEEIAERYSVSVDKIIRLNQLESAEVYAGQILYIPHS